MAYDSEGRYDLFISYAEADQDWVKSYLLYELERAGVRCYYEIAFTLGVPRLLEFERAILQSDRILLVLSSAYLADRFNEFTNVLAQSYGLDNARWPVIPLKLYPDIEIPPRLKQLTGLDATDPIHWSDIIERLCAEFQRPLPIPPPKPPCPYPGMIPFSEEDHHRFFGRRDEIRILVQKLRLDPFVVVIGPSGSGKSSLVFAGLVPALRSSTFFGPGEWLVLTVRPGSTPLTALKAVLGDLADLTHAVTLALASHPKARRLLLVVDQFEEIFAVATQYASHEVLPFQRLLIRLSEIPNCYVVLTVRADFYSELMETSLWHVIKEHRFEITRLQRAELREAIVRPATEVRVFLESVLVERLVAEAAEEPGILPFVQETLVLLWESLERSYLPLSAYEQLVPQQGINSGIKNTTGLQAAMVQRAERLFSRFIPSQQVITQRIFLRLVQFGEGRADTRRQLFMHELLESEENKDLFYQTIHLLTGSESRLLTLSGDEGARGRKVDIAHEALITGWPRLQGWLEEKRAAEQARRRLTELTARWARTGRRTGLLDEVELQEAETWLKNPAAAIIGIPHHLPELVATSRDTIENGRRREQVERYTLLSTACAARAQAQIDRDPELALLLAREAALIAWNQQIPIPSLTETVLHRSLRLSLLRLILRGHTSLINSVAYSPDGSTIASASGDGAVYLWDVETGTRKMTLSNQGKEFGVSCVSYNSNGHLLATTDWQGMVRVYNAFTGELRVAWRGHSNYASYVAWKPDSQHIVTASGDTVVKVWNPTTGHELQRLEGHEAGVSCVLYSPSGLQIVTTSYDKTTRLWDATKGSELRRFEGHSMGISSVDYHPSKQQIVTASYDGTVKVWDIQTGEELAELAGHGETYRAVYGRDGQRLVTVGTDWTARIWDTNTWQELAILRGHSHGVNTTTWSPDGHYILTGSSDMTMRLWAAKGEELPTLHLKGSEVRCATYSPAGRYIASGSNESTVCIWDAVTGQKLRWLIGHTDGVQCVVWSKDGQRLVTTGEDKIVHIWDMETGLMIHRLTGHEATVHCATFSPDGRAIATASDDGTVRIWDAVTGQEQQRLEDQTHAIYSIAWSPKGHHLTIAGEDWKLGVWDLRSGQKQRELIGHTGQVHSVTYSPEGRWILSASSDKTARIWDPFTGEEQRQLTGHTDVIYCATYCPSGQYVVTGSSDKTARIWNPTTGQEQVRLDGHLDTVRSVHYSADGRYLVTASKDGTIRQFLADTQELIQLSKTRVTRDLTPDEYTHHLNLL